MKKYVVLKERKLDNNIIDQEAVCFFDTEDEANEKAGELNDGIPVANKDKYEVSVGIVDEADLEEPDNWETYKQVEIISIFE